MVKLWTANPIQANDRVEFLLAPPKTVPSVCIGDSELSDPESLFADDDYWDLMVPYSNEDMADRFMRIQDWRDVEGWIARRDTPQSRWLDRLAMLNGHLGKAIIDLINRKTITVKQAD